MGLKDALNNAVDSVKDAVANAKDASSEAGHRTAAEAEQAKRDAAGDNLTLGEKAGSVFNQAKHNVQAEADAAKQDARNAT